MTTWQPLLFALPGFCGALAIAALAASFAPFQPDLAASVARVRTTATAAPATRDARGQLGAWISQHAQRIGLKVPTKALSILQISTERYFLSKAGFAAAGLIAPTLVGVILQLTAGLPFAIPLIFGILLGLLAWFIPDVMILDRARMARLEFARAVSVYLDLVATEIRRGVGPAQAVTGAAEIASSWVFVRLRQQIARANYEGTDPWTALQVLADDIDLPELAEAGQIIALAGEGGASVKEALVGRARSLRTKILKDHHQIERKRSTSLSFSQVMAGIAFIGLLGTPAVIQLTTSFS